MGDGMSKWEGMGKPEDAPKETEVLVLCEDEWNTWFMVGIVEDGQVIPDCGPLTPIKGWWALPKANERG
jgi:hypothetical protein